MKKRIHEKARSFLILLLTLGLQQAIAQPTASVSSLTNVACNGTATGSISVNFSHTASTTFTVQLDSAGTVIRTHTTASAAFSGSHTFNNVRANTYGVHVKENATNLTKTINGITVTQPTALVLTANIHNVRCKGLGNGAVKLFGSGGTLISGTYVFKKGTGSFSTVDTFSSFSPGGYNFYVSDDNGCFDTLVVSITEPAVLKLSISILNSTCKGGAKVDLAATGGTSPYQFDLLSTGIYNSTVQYLNFTDTSGVKSKVKDSKGCLDSSSLLIKHTDAVAPDSLRIITDTILYLDASGQALLPKKEVVKYTYDNCGVTDTTMKTVFTCADLGSATYTVTVKDAAGNAISKNIEIQVLDTLAPDTPTVYNITRYLDSNGRDTVLPVLLYNTSNDNCGITEIYTSDSFLTCGDTGTFGIIVFVKDKSGNISSDTAYVTLLDTLAPYNVVVRDSIVVYLGPNGTYTLHDSDYLISAFDNCKITDTLYSQKTFFCTDISGDSIMVYVRFRDASKNETLDSFAVYVLDTLAPIVNARTRDTVYLGPTVNPTKTIGVADIDLGSTDNSPCIPLDVKISGKTTFDCDDATKEFKVYLTGTDGYGNTAKDSTMVLVLDTVKPVIVLKSTIPPFYIGASGLNVIKVVDIDGGTYDNCAILKREIIGDSLKCTDGPTKKIVFRVTDKFGNIAQTAFNVSVLDTIKPALLTKSATLNIGTSGFAVLKVNDVISSATDNCNVDSMWISRDTFYVSDADPTLPFVIVSVRDKAGNITKKTQYVFVYVLDSDNDSIPDYIEKNFDTDGDGTLDYLDTDADNDGLADKTENNGKHALLDSDGDGIHDFRDLDSDNDGINDVIENGSTDVNGDGINDNPATILTVAVDTDTDGKPDYLDLDSDGDVLFDIFESLQGHTDANNDGQIDATADADKDGIIDQADGNTAAFGDNGDVKPIDTDSDVKMDFRDTDSDNDLIPDSVETAIDTDADGLADYRDTDSDNDKIPDTYEAGIDPTKPVDTDTDGLADFRDTDSDNDKIPDTYEAGADPTKPVDTDTDGKDDFRDLDSDGDTISDEVEAGADPKNPVDTDGDGKDDFRDLDSDGDGIPDAIEAGADPKNPVDTNNDGVEDFRDLDSDGDGISDAIERGADGNNPIDTDGDGIPDYRDTDADNDDIPDSDEGQADSDKNGIPDYRDAQYRIPEGFSPNGDGVNELFIIKGLKVYKNAQLIVFNRNGQVVFDSGDGYGNNWDGSSSSSMPSIGKDLPEGLYYFVFKPNAQNRADITGNLYIKR